MDNYGYIYCMSNKCMNGILKIGITNNNPQLRAKQLFNGNTGMPCEFEVKFSKRVKNPREVEKTIHNMLSNKRFPRREFFQVSEEEVRYIFSQFEGEWWDENGSIENQNIVEEDISSEDIYDEPNEPEEHKEDDEPSEDEEEDPVVAMLRQQQHTLTEQTLYNIKKNYESVKDVIDDLENNKIELYKQISMIDERISKMRENANEKASE